MRIRHKVPSLFTLSMVDVLCCALGCVILLWLLNAKQNDDESERHRLEHETLMAQARADHERSQQEQEQLNARLRSLVGDREKAAALSARLAERVRALEESETALRSTLAGERKKAADLEARLKSSAERVTALEADIRSGASRLEAERKRAGGLDRRLADAEKALKALRAELEVAQSRQRAEQMRADGLKKTVADREKDLAGLARMLEEARGARDRLEKTLAERDKELEKQRRARQDAAAEATRALAKLERERQALRAEAESRFAGIELTGRRVIFLVDASGSMELLDDKSPAPHKWKEVRETVARLMRSLPGLEKFQVIAFAAKAEFPLGAAGKWLDYEAKASQDRARKALANVKPSGGTNMYAALQAAFEYRDRGLDTVYLLSDGLPNLGEGLTAPQARNLSEVERGAVLGKYIRTTLRTGWNRAGPNRPRVRINTIGFFYESPDLGAFLWALARENEGSFVGMSKP